MNKLILILLAVTVSCTTGTKKIEEQNHDDLALHDHNKPSENTNKNAKSPHTATMANVGTNHVHIDYSSPRVRGRVIFGGLVAYGEVWSTGAHNATSINFTQDVVIDEKIIKKGKYAFFTIPGKEKWTVILNTNWDQHLADEYNIDEDVLRMEVTPIVSDEIKEELTFTVVAKDDKTGAIRFQWEKVAFEFDIINN